MNFRKGAQGPSSPEGYRSSWGAASGQGFGAPARLWLQCHCFPLTLAWVQVLLQSSLYPQEAGRAARKTLVSTFLSEIIFSSLTCYKKNSIPCQIYPCKLTQCRMTPQLLHFSHSKREGKILFVLSIFLQIE